MRMNLSSLKSILIFCVVLQLFSSVVYAETIQLKSGKSVIGKVVEKNYQYIKVDINVGMPITYFWDEIDNVDGINNKNQVVKAVAQSESSMTDFKEEMIYKSEIRNLFRAKNFSELDKIAAQLRQSKVSMMSGKKKLAIFYSAISESEVDNIPGQQKIIATLNEWIQQRPTDYTVKILFAEVYKNLAWNYRGSGLINTVSETSIQGFSNYISKSWAICQDLQLLDTNDPQLYASCLSAGTGMQITQEEAYLLVESSMKIDPEYFRSYNRMAVYLLPRWSGEPGDVKKFINWVITHVDERQGKKLYARLAEGLRAFDSREIDNNQFVWGSLKEGFDELRKEFPDSFLILNSYCWFAVHYKDKELSIRLFDLIGDRRDEFSDLVWTNKYTFNEAKDWALKNASNISSQMNELIREEEVPGFLKLMTSGIDINLADVNGLTILDNAVLSRKFVIAKSILNLPSINIHSKDKWGREVIHFAAMVGAPEEIIQKIINKGADVNQGDFSEGLTPLHYAAEDGSYEAIDFLLQYPNININSRNKNKQTPLHLAVKAGKDESVKILLASTKILVNPKDAYGNTPLMEAARYGFLRIVEMLLNGGADIKFRNNNGFSTLDIALENNENDIVQLLLSHGAKQDGAAITKEKYAAARRHNLEGVEHLKKYEFEEARREFAQAVNLDPYLAEPYFNLSLIEFNFDHDYKKTEELLRKAIALRPEVSGYYYRLGQLLQKLNRMPEAMENFKLFISLEPDKKNEAVKEIMAKFSIWLIALWLVPIFIFYWMRQYSPTKLWQFTGFAFGAIISLAASGLYGLYFIWPIHPFIGILIGIPFSMIHSDPGYHLAKWLGFIQHRTDLEAMEYLYTELWNAIVWAGVYGTLGLLIDKFITRRSNFKNHGEWY